MASPLTSRWKSGSGAASATPCDTTLTIPPVAPPGRSIVASAAGLNRQKLSPTWWLELAHSVPRRPRSRRDSLKSPGSNRSARQDRLAVKRPARLPRIGVGRISGQPDQHRRHSKRQRDVARRRLLHRDEIHVGGRQAKRLPCQTAIEQQRPSGIGASRKLLAQLLL